MVDVKKVTATIKKPSIYGSPVNTSVTDESIDIDPTASAPTIYSIDPFAVFQRSSSRLEVKIPFTRFYRIKTVLSYSGFTTSSTTVDKFSASKPLLGSTESLTINRISNGVTTQVNTNIYTQDASGYVIFTPTNSNATTFSKDYTVTPAVVEGIVELYAGDTLYFTHSRKFFQQANLAINQLTGSIYITDPQGAAGSYLHRGSLIFDILGNYLADQYLAYLATTDSSVSASFVNPYSSNSSFFFEISEITDL